MLTLRPIVNPHETREELSRFEPDQATWLVSDLKSKFDLNRSLLNEREFVPGDAVLRASEFWKLLLTRVRPDLQLVSREFILTMIADRIGSFDLDWAKAPGAAQVVFDYLTQLIPILSHPRGDELMKEWFANNEGSYARWGRWYDLAEKLWRVFLEEGYLAPAWASGVLVNEPEVANAWAKPLFVDLGSELNQVEADLLLILADQLDVVVYKPAPEWSADFAKSLIAYQVIESKLGITKETVGEAAVSRVSRSTSGRRDHVMYRKYTTMIGEVKDATAKIRKWLDAGDVKPIDIAVVAPDIETYWPALSAYLEQEGIPVQKDVVRRMHSFPDVARWLARLRLKTGAYDESDVELALFTSTFGSSRLISYERFKTLYSVIYGREDLARESKIEKAFEVELSTTQQAVRDDFIKWSLKQLSEDVNFDRIESIYKKVFAECPQTLTFPVQRWLAYLEQIAARVECRVRDGDPDGIAVIKLSSAEHSSAKKMIVLGLTESALKQSVGTAILFSDIMSLAREFGFHLASEDQARLEFEARWLIENADRELILCVPETDFNGAAQAPSWLWIDGARHDEKALEVTIPEATRWDELQASELTTIGAARNWTAARSLIVDRAMKEDFGEQELEVFANDLLKSLSPSKIEDYLDCPFIYATKYLFRLSDQAELDLEIDALRRGSLMHKVFELLSVEPMKFDLTNEELETLVEEAKEKSELELADIRLWKPLRSKHIDLARRYLAYEKEYRQQFPTVKTIGRELLVEGYLRPETGELIPNDEPGAIRFGGRIDRVDVDQAGNVAIYDYKSSTSSATQFGNWIEKNQIQLLLYAMAVEKGLTEIEPHPVLSAIYYVARPFSRDQGYKVEGVEQGLYDFPDRKKNKIDLATKERLFQEAQALVKQAVDGIRAGKFQPRPRDVQLCGECRWSIVCRTPHLNG